MIPLKICYKSRFDSFMLILAASMMHNNSSSNNDAYRQASGMMGQDPEDLRVPTSSPFLNRGAMGVPGAGGAPPGQNPMQPMGSALLDTYLSMIAAAGGDSASMAAALGSFPGRAAAFAAQAAAAQQMGGGGLGVRGSSVSTFFSGVSLLAMILLARPWLEQIPMAALVAVMISIAISTADMAGLRRLARIPVSDTSVMLMTFAVTMLTTPHNLALGVLAGVALAGILFSRKVAKVIQVEAIDVSDQERRYRVVGQLFFVSKVYFLQGFDLHDHPERIVIDLSSAHIWDQSGVAALDQVIRKFRLGGSEVSVEGLNDESLDLFERIGGQESAHA